MSFKTVTFLFTSEIFNEKQRHLLYNTHYQIRCQFNCTAASIRHKTDGELVVVAVARVVEANLYIAKEKSVSSSGKYLSSSILFICNQAKTPKQTNASFISLLEQPFPPSTSFH